MATLSILTLICPFLLNWNWRKSEWTILKLDGWSVSPRSCESGVQNGDFVKPILVISQNAVLIITKYNQIENQFTDFNENKSQCCQSTY